MSVRYCARPLKPSKSVNNLCPKPSKNVNKSPKKVSRFVIFWQAIPFYIAIIACLHLYCSILLIFLYYIGFLASCQVKNSSKNSNFFLTHYSFLGNFCWFYCFCVTIWHFYCSFIAVLQFPLQLLACLYYIHSNFFLTSITKTAVFRARWGPILVGGGVSFAS